MTVESVITNQVHGEVALMIIRPMKSDTFAWFLVLSWIPLAWVLKFCDIFDTSHAIELSMICVIFVTLYFTAAFSVYELTSEGITQKVFFVSRHFAWSEFKFIGIQTPRGGLFTPPTQANLIRCSTVPLPKSMTKDQFAHKNYWNPTKTITIELYEKNGDEVYREFLSYCGGERDIRE